MNSQKPVIPYEPADDEIDLLALAAAIWQRRWIVIGAVIASVAVAIFYLNVATYKHTAELKVIPSQSSGVGGSSTGGLAGLASLAGVNLSKDGGVSPFEQYLEGINSGLVAETLSDNTKIMKELFRSEWDENTQRFVERRGLLSNVAQSIKGVLGLPTYPWQEPNTARLQGYIQENVVVSENPKSQFVTVSFEHSDPKFARLFLTELHETLNEELRQKALVRSTKYINYLTAQLQRVTIAEHREALVQALSEQEKFRMTASSGLAYAADPFGSVTVSLRPTSPRPAIVIILSIVLGGVIGSLAAIVAWWLGEKRRSTTASSSAEFSTSNSLEKV